MRKHNDFSGVGRSAHVNLQSKGSPGAFYTRKHNDFSAIGGGLRRGCILIRNRDGDVHVLRTCTHVLAFMFHVTEQVGLGLGWGGGVKFLYIERKITSVVHSHPPSHYIRIRAFLPTT